MELPEFVFLGYCAKQVVTLQDREIASVSECIAKRPPDWVARWDFNRATCWDSESGALACVPADSPEPYRLFAYRVLPLLFDASAEARVIGVNELFPSDLPALPSGAPPENYRKLGYDVVERNIAMGILGFGCSPLSCNNMADEIPVNRFCLIGSLDAALAAARVFATGKAEPGPYVIVEVLGREPASNMVV